MKQYLINILIVIAFVATIQPIQAQEQVNTLEAHVHGLSELMIVAEGNALEIQLISPAINLLGFEHKASTSKDIMIVEKTALRLSQHDALFLISDADCTLINKSIDLSKIIDTDITKKTQQHESNDDEHKHDHDVYEQDKVHINIVANYKYRCKNSASLSSITVTLFELFPGIHEIRAMWVDQTLQGAITLTPNHRVIKF